MRRAKIVCTIGPASREPDTLKALVRAGMDVARLNMSHGTREEHREVVERVRAIGREEGRAVGILQDLSGPKIRLGRLEKPVLLHAGQEITLTVEDRTGTGTIFPVSYAPLPGEAREGDRISLADGLVMLEVIRTEKAAVRARVLAGGTVSSHKGVNLPGGGLQLPALTPKDAEDLRFGLQAGVDWVALSFVRAPSDADAPRALMAAAGRRVPLLAKIEKSEAVARSEAILEAFDGLMVARGDLGVEAPLEDIPGIQKDLIRKANAAAKPVITATQMLLSMVASPTPTRAEVTDVANAILDGTDALMLSEETAQGRYPVPAVERMATLAQRAESLRDRFGYHAPEPQAGTVAAAIARATSNVARSVGARVIVTPTTSGSTARLVASTRPDVPILALSSAKATVNALTLCWGVVPRLLEPVPTTDALFAACRAEALRSGLARAGERIVVTAGVPLEVAGGTNLLRVLEL